MISNHELYLTKIKEEKGILALLISEHNNFVSYEANYCKNLSFNLLSITIKKNKYSKYGYSSYRFFNGGRSKSTIVSYNNNKFLYEFNRESIRTLVQFNGCRTSILIIKKKDLFSKNNVTQYNYLYIGEYDEENLEIKNINRVIFDKMNKAQKIETISPIEYNEYPRKQKMKNKRDYFAQKGKEILDNGYYYIYHYSTYNE